MIRRRFPLALVALATLTGCPIIVSVEPLRTPPPPNVQPTRVPEPERTVTWTPPPGTEPATATPTPAPPGTWTPYPATPGPNDTPWPSPSASAPQPGTPTVIISGTVYDEEGQAVDGALIMVRSLDASVPYTATATTAQGSWVVNNLPEGVNAEIVATKDGWTTRRRVGSFQRGAPWPTIDFGAPETPTDPGANRQADLHGGAYFISDYPEIRDVEPQDDAREVDPSAIAFKLTLSEPLDEDSRDLIAEGIRLWPANAAAGAPGAVDMTDQANRDVSDGLAGAPALDFGAQPLAAAIGYVVEEGSRFMDDDTNRARTTWNAEGTEVTLTFAAPYVNGSRDEARYQVGLVAGDEAIEDEDGNPLGTDHAGQLGQRPEAGRLLANLFRIWDVPQPLGPNDSVDANARWARTHDSVAAWELRTDDQAPKLVGVDGETEGGDALLRLTFSEPMAGYDGTATGHVGAGTAGASALANYVFAVATSRDGLANTELGEGMPITINVQSQPAFAVNERGKPFRLGASGGLVTAAVDARDPRTVVLRLAGKAGFFAGNKAIKARVAGAADPAGNVIDDAQADDDQVLGAI